MAKKPLETVLTDHEKIKFQRRLSSYLRDYEYKNNIMAKDVAKYLDISQNRYSHIKSDNSPYEKFINCIDYLVKFANLEGLSISEFMDYLEGKRDKEEAKQVKFTLWQKTLLDSFEQLTTKSRSPFIELCRDSQREGKKKLEALIELVGLLKNKDFETISLLKSTLENLTKS